MSREPQDRSDLEKIFPIMSQSKSISPVAENEQPSISLSLTYARNPTTKLPILSRTERNHYGTVTKRFPLPYLHPMWKIGIQLPHSESCIKTGNAKLHLQEFWKLKSGRRDAILDHFDLDRLQFQPYYEDRDDCVSIIVPDISDRDKPAGALGFIRYDKKTGRTLLANPCARLAPEILDLGHSSKRQSTSLSGCHGEGLKLAALVMSRNGHNVKILTSNSHWNFSLAGSKFRCIVRPSGSIGDGTETDSTTDMAQMRSCAARDVTVMIEPSKGKQGKKISLAAFRTWMKMTLDVRISYPSDIIETEVGDLILDPEFSGRIYLKGLLLPVTCSEFKPYKLGYNFTSGGVNRDRQFMVNKDEEAKAVKQIWEHAIQMNQRLVLPKYVDFLRNFPEAPDVNSADMLLGETTKALVWKYLLEDAGNNLFFYSEKSNAPTITVIRDLLKKQPARLPELLWNFLRSESLIRTPEEEHIKTFRNAQICVSPASSFGRMIQRALKACLALIPESKGIEVHFVQSETIGIDILFDIKQRALKVHERWLDFQEIHRDSPCRAFFPNEMTGREAPFFCIHVIDELLRVSLGSLFRPRNITRATENNMLRQIRLSLRYMPHSIKVMRASQIGCLIISWEDNETESFRKSSSLGIPYHIVLHEEKCFNASMELLHGDTVNSGTGVAPCGCLHTFATQNNKVASFASLNFSTCYYPMIALNCPGAFYGMPPQPIAPTPFLTASPVTRKQLIDFKPSFEFQQHHPTVHGRSSELNTRSVNLKAQRQEQQGSPQNWRSVRGTEHFSQSQLALELRADMLSSISLKREPEATQDTYGKRDRKLPKHL